MSVGVVLIVFGMSLIVIINALLSLNTRMHNTTATK